MCINYEDLNSKFLEEIQKEIRHGLLVYCELDTLAMVKLWKKLCKLYSTKCDKRNNKK